MMRSDRLKIIMVGIVVAVIFAAGVFIIMNHNENDIFGRGSSFSVSIGEIKNTGLPDDFQYREVTATPLYAEEGAEHLWFYVVQERIMGDMQTTETFHVEMDTSLLQQMVIYHYVKHANGESALSKWTFSEKDLK